MASSIVIVLHVGKRTEKGAETVARSQTAHTVREQYVDLLCDAVLKFGLAYIDQETRPERAR